MPWANGRRWFFRQERPETSAWSGAAKIEKSERAAGPQKGFREIILQDLYKDAIKCGIKKDDFFHYTLNDIKQIIEAKEQERVEAVKKIEFESWTIGAYVKFAFVSSLNKNCKYPQNPLEKKEEKVDISKLSAGELADLQIKELQKLDLSARMALGVDSKKQDG